MGNQTIQIDTDTLMNITDDFDTIKSALNGFSITAPAKVGDGLTIKELAEVEDEYIAIKDALIALLDNTKGFMVQASLDVSDLDDSIAAKMNLEE